MPTVVKEFTGEERKLIMALRTKTVNRIEIVTTKRRVAFHDILLNPRFRLVDEGRTLKILANQE